MTADVLRLVATDMASGPHDLADVVRLLHTHAMPAAAWKIEGAIELIAEWENDYYRLAEGFDKMTDAEAKYLESSRTVADAKQFVARIRKLLEEYE